MQELHNLQTSQLFDLLAEHTTLITKLFAEKRQGEEYNKEKMLVKAIQSELEFRRTQADLSIDITPLPDFIN